MKIDKSGVKVVFEFSPATHFLVLKDSRGMGKEWSLNPRIDRSEKGKDDDVGIEDIYLTDEQAMDSTEDHLKK